MEVRKLLRALVVLVLCVGMLSEKSTASTFKECYTKCFIFCMIEPSQTLCSCTTNCLKDCIFQEIQNDVHDDSDNLGFCKLGCAFSMCSAFSSKHKPNGEKVDGCVGSCSNKCTKSYTSP
ncbi:hypothetical protein SASPL_115807 [Salvia splendens]|uniref:Thionin-like protein 2 n=1 Tax=Salvia splendens TaxID=180675 RepID=A0A8X8Y371_SALSN|nr:thionin-like protein 2 [Salvia splendens]KAG6425376.1 hypothetical protein SASPL_115807 [Salvia splendens]